jgi:hypothetical protein
MGVDAVMWITLDRDIPAHEVRKVGVQCCVALGWQGVLCQSPPSEWDTSGTSALVRQNTPSLESLPMATTYVECNLECRYFGPDYARGPITHILSTTRWIRGVWPDARIWYGGDSSDHLLEMTPEYEKELWDYFAGPNGRSYYDHGERRPTVMCDFCDVKCISNMTSGSSSGHYCPACGRRWIRDHAGGVRQTDEHYQELGDKPRDPRDTLRLSKRRVDAIVAQLYDGSDPRSALVDLEMLLAETNQ